MFSQPRTAPRTQSPVQSNCNRPWFATSQELQPTDIMADHPENLVKAVPLHSTTDALDDMEKPLVSPTTGSSPENEPSPTNCSPEDIQSTDKITTLDESGGGSIPVDKEGPEGEGGANDSTVEEGQSSSPATLFCPVNGYPHSRTLSFGNYQCEVCLQILTKSPRAHQTQDGDADTGSLKEDSKTPAADGEGQNDAMPIVEHQVEYRDAEGGVIRTDDCDSPFDLERERNLVLRNVSNRNKETVMKAVTVVQTSLPCQRNSWYSFRDMRLPAASDIIGNTQISVRVEYTTMFVLSRLFIDLLKSVVSYDPGDTLEGTNVEIYEPFSIIGHHLQALEDYVQRIDERLSISPDTMSTNSDAEASTASQNEVSPLEIETGIHVRLVLEYVNSVLKEPISQERTIYQQNVPMCTYRMLWYLFRPGSMVYNMSEDAPEAYMVDSVDMDKFTLSSPDSKPTCTINLWYLDFNGEYITRARHEVEIKPFEGERPITSLNVVPCEIIDNMDGGKVRAMLEERGKKWVDHLSGKPLIYKQPFKFGRRMVNGRAYADPAAYFGLENNSLSFEPVNNDTATAWHKGKKNYSHRRSSFLFGEPKKYYILKSRYDNISLKEMDTFEDDSGLRIAHILCSWELVAFVFNTRTWEFLNIAYCHPVKPDRNPFAKLVMPQERKLMIKALVYRYTDPKYAGRDGSQVWGADFIKNKGEGQVFLLHGGPGVGKTFTAECIAEFTGRPLLSLTCGDIGTNEVEMERELRRWLRLAHRWGAVMLIDEADVFLEKRMEADLQRNSLVSIFLREIEYYQGILFLTSNRVGKFDDAIVSRIHVVIHYKSLDDSYRKKIWKQFFDKLATERGASMKIETSAKSYVLEDERMVKMKWNGREIRNAFQTAVALAEYRFLTKPESEKDEGEVAVLEEDDFKQICEMTMNFKEYLIKLNEGKDEEARAVSDRTWGAGD